MKNVFFSNGYTFGILTSSASDQALLAQYEALRAKVWCDMKHWEERTSGNETDEFDVTSEYGVVVDSSGCVLGGTRFIRSASVLELPFYSYVDEDKRSFDPGPALEVSRWCIQPNLRNKVRKDAHFTMISGAMMYLASLNHSEVYMDVCAPLFSLLQRIGLELRQVGKIHSRKTSVSEDEFVPAVLKVQQMANQAAA